ncbi:MAG: pilus assembly protein N-terminal domain-containing protein [Deltaproteobacteria bacterium]|nr:pilus assembly protein N-terminal domain-containing protein [Deltaproteobacteria bacterium]
MRLLLLLACVLPALSEASVRKITLGTGFSRVIRIPQLVRVAIANSKIAKVRAVPPDQVLVTGIARGTTTLQVWASANQQSTYEISVVPAELAEPLNGDENDSVVKIALEFIEMDNSFGQSLGIRWPEASQFSGHFTYSGSDSTSGINYTAAFSSARGLIQHLLKEGWAKMIANPDLYVRLGEEAIFHSGGEFPIPTSSESGGRYWRHVEWKPFGLTVKVRPKSIDKVHFHSDVKVELSETNVSSAVEGIPSLTRRQLETKMYSLDGETVILSGLLRQASSATREGLPWLSSIPLVGFLFGSRNQSSETTELVLAVTFSINHASKNSAKLEEMERKFRSHGN